MNRNLAVLIFGILITLLSFSKIEAAEKLFINRNDTGSKIILSNGTAYIPLEVVAEKLGTYVAWFPSSRIVIFNGVQISQFVRRNGIIYASAKEVANTFGGAIKYNKQTRDLYLSVGNMPFNNVANKSNSIDDDLTTVYPSRPESKLSTYMTNIPAIQSKGAFAQKSGKNSVFSVTVTDMEEISVIKNRYNASAGNKYFVIYVSQQNISSDVQIYTGKFTLSDENSHIYDYMEGLSNYWLSILKPGGVNYGYLVFEVPKSSRASKLILNALNQPPLAIDLIHG